MEAFWDSSNTSKKSSSEIISYGESTTHSEPFYNGEFDQTVFSFHNRVLPHLIGKNFSSPRDLHQILDAIKFNKQNRFAIASLDIAFHDAFSQEKGVPLNRYLLSHYKYPANNIITEVPVGISRGMKSSPEELAKSVLEFIRAGNKKIKLKISPDKDLEYIEAVRNIIKSQDITLSADANSSYNELDEDHFNRILDIVSKVDLLEQPFSYDDTWGHALLTSLLNKKGLKTKICLDESIRYLKDLKNFVSQVEMILNLPVEEFSHSIAVNIKISRVGGLYEAMRIAQYCMDKNIDIMPGGMHEFDFGQSAIVSFNSINSNFYPGDSEGSETYYCGALTALDGKRFEGLKTNENGNLSVPVEPGLGVGSLIWDELLQIGPFTYISKLDLDLNRWSPDWNPVLLEKVKKDVQSQPF